MLINIDLRWSIVQIEKHTPSYSWEEPAHYETGISSSMTSRRAAVYCKKRLEEKTKDIRLLRCYQYKLCWEFIYWRRIDGTQVFPEKYIKIRSRWLKIYNSRKPIHNLPVKDSLRCVTILDYEREYRERREKRKKK